MKKLIFTLLFVSTYFLSSANTAPKSIFNTNNYSTHFVSSVNKSFMTMNNLEEGGFDPWMATSVALAFNVVLWDRSKAYKWPDGSRTGFIPLVLSYNMALTSLFGDIDNWMKYAQLGAWAGFNTNGYKYNDSYKNSLTTFSIGVSMVYYFNHLLNISSSSPWMIYAILRIGAEFNKYKDSFGDGGNENSNSNTYLRLLPAAGIEYMFLKSFSAYVQLGLNPYGLVEAGAKFHIPNSRLHQRTPTTN